MIDTESRSAYTRHVASLAERLQGDRALREAVGGEFLAVGKLEYHLLRSLGLRDGHLVIDVGCGSGRLAAQLAPFPGIRYRGCDVVPALLDHARRLCQRPDWTFLATDGWPSLPPTAKPTSSAFSRSSPTCYTKTPTATCSTPPVCSAPAAGLYFPS